jgi:hypothetical protein
MQAMPLSELDKSTTLFRNSSREINPSIHIPHSLTQTTSQLATMVFPAPYPSAPKPNAFSPRPVAPEVDNSIAQVVGYAEPVDGVSFDFFDLESLDTPFHWELGGALPDATLGSLLKGGLVSSFIHDKTTY